MKFKVLLNVDYIIIILMPEGPFCQIHAHVCITKLVKRSPTYFPHRLNAKSLIHVVDLPYLFNVIQFFLDFFRVEADTYHLKVKVMFGPYH